MASQGKSYAATFLFGGKERHEYLLLGGFELVFGRIELSLDGIKLRLAYLQLGIRTSRFAIGLPVGSEVEYADEITLARAIEGRSEL